MRKHTRDHQVMVTDTSKATNFGAVLLITCFMLVSNPIHWYHAFLLTNLFQVG